MGIIAENYKDILADIRQTCEACGRDPQEVTLIAVSKTKPVADLQDAYAGGARIFGENKVQELCEKAETLGDDYCFHMIGHLQKNKVKKCIQHAAIIHSVDTLELAKAIDKEAAKLGKQQDILLEVNVAMEESKFGLSLSEAKALALEVTALDNLRLRGLMTVAPYTKNAEENRKYFRALRELLIDIKREIYDNEDINVLSMGMSGDYRIAVEEGATHVRVGTSIFGERWYPEKSQA